jgi:hypothetical protein
VIPTLAQAVRVGTPEVLFAKVQGKPAAGMTSLLADDLSGGIPNVGVECALDPASIGQLDREFAGDAADDAVAPAKREAAMHFTNVNGAVDVRFAC